MIIPCHSQQGKRCSFLKLFFPIVNTYVHSFTHSHVRSLIHCHPHIHLLTCFLSTWLPLTRLLSISYTFICSLTFSLYVVHSSLSPLPGGKGAWEILLIIIIIIIIIHSSSLTHSQSVTHPLTHSLISQSLTTSHSLPLTHSVIHAFTHSLTVTHSLSLSHSLPLTHSLTHSHLLTHLLTLAHSLTSYHSLTHSYSLPLTHSLSLTLTHSLTHYRSLTIVHSLTHSLTLTHSVSQSLTHSRKRSWFSAGLQPTFRSDSAPQRVQMQVAAEPVKRDMAGRLSQLERLQYELTRQVPESRLWRTNMKGTWEDWRRKVGKWKIVLVTKISDRCDTNTVDNCDNGNNTGDNGIVMWIMQDMKVTSNKTLMALLSWNFSEYMFLNCSFRAHLAELWSKRMWVIYHAWTMFKRLLALLHPFSPIGAAVCSEVCTPSKPRWPYPWKGPAPSSYLTW